jgi:uncharacterized iron-regulated protein
LTAPWTARAPAPARSGSPGGTHEGVRQGSPEPLAVPRRGAAGRARRLGALCLLALTASCSSPAKQPKWPTVHIRLPAEARELVMVDGADGSPVAWDELVDRARGVDVVFVGESHGHEQGLAAAAFLFEELLDDDGLSPALAMEFFTRDEQVHVDDYLSGVTTEAKFVAALRRTRGRYPDGHRAMMRAAHKADAPVWAANAPRRYVTMARTKGFEPLRELGPRQAALFEVPEALTTGRYRERFVEIMTEHGGSPSEAGVDSSFRSQNLWDATMADSVARALDEGGRPVVLVVGRFHVEFEGGTVQRLRAAAPDASVLTLAFLDENAEALREEDEGVADVVIYIGEFPEED